MKRFLCLVFAIMMLMLTVPAAAFADAGGDAAPVDPFADISTPYLYLLEASTGAVLYSRSGDQRAFPASTTKLMTAIVAIENLPDLNRVVTLGWRPVSGFGPKSSLMGLVAGEEIALIDILYGLLLRSGNDAAKALAIEAAYARYGTETPASDTVSLFVELMNQKAAEFGMTSTHFATVDGRHDPEHYTTAHDFGILMQRALENPLIAQIIATPTHTVAPTNKHPSGFVLENSNKLICKKEADRESYLYPSCIGGKTGETNEAGYCLISAARQNDVTLILVQFGDNNSTMETTYRYTVAKRLYDWGFENYRAFALSEFGLNTEFELQAVNCSPLDPFVGRFAARAKLDGLSVTGALSNLQSYFDDPTKIRAEVSADHVDAPIRKGDVVGYVDYYFYENTSVRAELIAERDVASAADNGRTPEPHETAFISTTPPPGSGKNSNLGLQRSAGSDEYSVWIYYDNSLYTMNNTEWHYLYLTDNVFRSASTLDEVGSVKLYRLCFDSSGTPYYELSDGVSDGASYVITIDGYALTTSSREGTLAAVPITPGANRIITSGVTDEMVWRFDSRSNGYLISNGSKYLARRAGSGILFWVLIVVLVLVAVVLARLIVVRRKRRRLPPRRSPSRYRGSWS